jgi:periplasmic copper chaperone A
MMVMVKSITIPAHGQVSFAEGGYHLMCMQPKMKLGDKVGMTLTFGDGDNLLLLVPVYGPSGPGSQ